ncbi:hypothetical protein [Pseudonocardia dioxanivorans]|uniref:hypothetical protein n=1 Tax=Pseudonocardia dioxanivorans TaxID=240495 RepID=UPI0002E8D547|nr:hypothetical protein [Pseudonocardia dioxanivorans]
MNAELRAAAKPVRRAVQAAVLGASFPDAEPAAGGGGESRGLRAGLARATEIHDLSNGVRFAVDGNKVGIERGHRLAQLTDTETAPRWRHPVRGRRDRKWRTQIGRPWFFVTIRGGRPKFEAGVERGMAKTARRIEG